LALEQWTIQESLECYNILNWGKDYFAINAAGHVVVHPDKNPARAIDLKELVDQLRTRGIQLPILIRFTDILRHRVREIHEAFKNAMTEFEYQGGYSCVYPVKVNQQRHVVEEILDFGREFGFGLEAGSKPELLAVLAVTAGNGVPVVCNGFKDDEFIETVILAQKIGRNVIPVVEKFTELEMIIRHAERLGVRPKIGVRVKLASKGSGRWESSAGYRAKFGLNVMEILAAIDFLKERQMGDCLNLLHFHIGSQVTNIRKIKEALTEAGRIYVEMIRAGAGLTMIDVGGGLGVDYDGSQSNFDSSINYTLQEYANDIVFKLKTVCDEAKVAHPKIISESGRAVTAYHSLLVFNVLGVARFDDQKPMKKLPDDAPQQLKDLRWILDHITKKNFVESYHDAVQIREDALNLFNLGFFSLEKRGEVESLYWRICGKIQKIVKELDYVPDELENLESVLADTYFCNFSIFQSMPDSWAIRQLFPIMPLQRLNENPTRRAILADVTCDSDGKLERFIDLHDVKKVLELHPFDGKEDYYIGAFLIGAYQEILGDLHNLFGDTNAVHVSLDEDGEVNVDHLVKGDTVYQILKYVEYNPEELIAAMRRDIERAVRDKKITLEESARFQKFYESGLNGYTYLEDPHER
jgi:arginine decarboxylase